MRTGSTGPRTVTGRMLVAVLTVALLVLAAGCGDEGGGVTAEEPDQSASRSADSDGSGEMGTTLQLTHNTWKLDGLIHAHGKSPAPRGKATVRITAEGDVALSTFCNTGGGSAKIAEDTIEFGRMTTTARACTDPARQEAEMMMAAVLEGRATYALHGTELTIKKGEKGLRFTLAR